MLQVNGPIFGNVTPVAFLEGSRRLIKMRQPGSHLDALKQVLGLGYARILGMQEGRNDPFTHVPAAQAMLSELFNDVKAHDAVDPDDWRALYEDGCGAAGQGGKGDPDLLAATLLSLNAYALAEVETLMFCMMTTGATEEISMTTAAATVTTGLAIATMGDMSAWAAWLARSNRRALASVHGAAAEACRTLQATTLKRFEKIHDIDDIEGAYEEQIAQNSALRGIIGGVST